MQQNSKIGVSSSPDFLCQHPKLLFVIIGFLFISAFCIRLYHINRPPLDFAPIRQYQNAHNARAYYFNTLESVSEERKNIANINAERMGFALEPRIMEHLAVFGYRIAGAEKLWIPRVLSSIFWVVGGIFLFLTAKKIANVTNALFSMVFFLFLPFAISASRSFQPDPMMIMMLLISIYAIVLNYDKPSKLRFVIAAIFSAFALFIKPYCIFLIFGAYLSLYIKKQGIRRTLLDPNVILFSSISILPAFIYYGYSSINYSDAQVHMQSSFLPYLLLQPAFWRDWLKMIGLVVGYIAFAASIVGIFMSRGLARTVITGLWFGYVFFGLIFTFHIHTHDYYQLPFIPVAALSLGSVANAITNRIIKSKLWALSLLILIIVIVIGVSKMSDSRLKDYKTQLEVAGTVIGVNPQFYGFLKGDYTSEVQMAKEIGEIVGHSTNTVFLTFDYGRSLSYHGELSGLPWPISISWQDRQLTGVPLPDKDEIFNSRYFTIRTHGKYIRYSPSYFIVTDFKEFDMQPDLKAFLFNNFPVKANKDHYVIFDTSKMSMPAI